MAHSYNRFITCTSESYTFYVVYIFIFLVILMLYSKTALYKYLLENTTNMKDTSCITMKHWVWWLMPKKKTSNRKISKSRLSTFFYYYNERREMLKKDMLTCIIVSFIFCVFQIRLLKPPTAALNKCDSS